MNIACLPDETLLSILKRVPIGLLPLYAEVCQRWRQLIAAYLDDVGWPSLDMVRVSRYRSDALHQLACERCPIAIEVHGHSLRSLDQPKIEAFSGGNVALDGIVGMMRREHALRFGVAYLPDEAVGLIKDTLKQYVHDCAISLSWLQRVLGDECRTISEPTIQPRGIRWRTVADVEAVFGPITASAWYRTRTMIMADQPQAVTDAAVAQRRFLYGACEYGAWRILEAILERQTARPPPSVVGEMFTRVLDGYNWCLPPLGAPDTMVILLERGFCPSFRHVLRIWRFASWKGLWLYLDALPDPTHVQPIQKDHAAGRLIDDGRIPTMADLEQCQRRGIVLSGIRVWGLVCSLAAVDSGVADLAVERCQGNTKRELARAAKQDARLVVQRRAPARVRAAKERVRAALASPSPV